LARLDIDPWEEAAALARLTRESAIERLTSIIANLPDRSAATASAKTVATRLITLLPRIARLESTSRTPVAGMAGLMRAQPPFIYVMMLFLFVAIAVNYVDAVVPPAHLASPHATHRSETLPKKSADSVRK
jgi:hypothetical protein